MIKNVIRILLIIVIFVLCGCNNREANPYVYLYTSNEETGIESEWGKNYDNRVIEEIIDYYLSNGEKNINLNGYDEYNLAINTREHGEIYSYMYVNDSECFLYTENKGYIEVPISLFKQIKTPKDLSFVYFDDGFSYEELLERYRGNINDLKNADDIFYNEKAIKSKEEAARDAEVILASYIESSKERGETPKICTGYIKEKGVYFIEYSESNYKHLWKCMAQILLSEGDASIVAFWNNNN